MSEEPMFRHERTSELGRLGELLAMDLLRNTGFEDVVDLNGTSNFPYADLLGTWSGKKYLISVKTRCESRDNGLLNESYNLIKINDRANRRLQADGKTTEQITELIWQTVDKIAAQWDARPAWIAIPVRPELGEYSAYFGEPLRHIRSIPMTPQARARYRELAPVGTRDPRITPRLSNRKS